MRSLLLFFALVAAAAGISLEAMKFTFNRPNLLSDKSNRQHEKHHEESRTSMPWPVLKPIKELDTEDLEGRWFTIVSNLITYSMLGAVPKCSTKDLFFAENKQSMQMMSTADFYMPETGPEKTERVRMGGRLTFPFSDGRIHASVGVQSARRFDEETNMMIVKRASKERRQRNHRADYLVMTDPTANVLCVMVRDVSEFAQNGMGEVMEFLEETQFVQPFNRPLLLNHTDCNYADIMPPTVAPEIFETTKMEGRWFQAIGNFFLSQFSAFDRHAKCVTLDWAVDVKTGDIETMGSKQDIETGEMSTEQGTLEYQGEGSPIYKYHPSKAHGANTWIIAAGPVDSERFEWIVQSDPLSLSLWVLARDMGTFESKYKAEVMNLLKERGFRFFWNKPVFIDHKDCKYPPLPMGSWASSAF